MRSRVVPWVTVMKIRGPGECIKLLYGRSFGAIVRPRVCAGMVPLITFHGNTFLAFRCVENLKPLRLKLQAK